MNTPLPSFALLTVDGIAVNSVKGGRNSRRSLSKESLPNLSPRAYSIASSTTNAFPLLAGATDRQQSRQYAWRGLFQQWLSALPRQVYAAQLVFMVLILIFICTFNHTTTLSSHTLWPGHIHAYPSHRCRCCR